ncbi:VOC family protein [Diaphorobacter aerolatus]|uniref:VOC family protein n=1 Tax=Diaphorobacter aerolatus TaxID=1288495 RepID=A0A7H0GI07_9BURK|nr:VOC family protein [Diaphorobacter aerolatus]QNP47923.1 VOC family protein [Diaphorobacter aerolatus]
MDMLVEWSGIGIAGIQLVEDASRAGNSMMTIVVPDIETVRASLSSQQIDLGEAQRGDFGKIARLTDPDGNTITFAQPPDKAFPKT